MVAALAAAAVLSARGPDPDAVPTAEAVEGRVMSTWCPGLTLAECPSSQAAALRDRIASWVAQGWTNRRIDAWLVDNYGESVLGRPRSAAAFLVPVAAVIAGVIVVALALRRRLSADPDRGHGAEAAPPPGVAEPERERLEADLRRFAGEATE